MPLTPSVPAPETPTLKTSPIILMGDAPEHRQPFDGDVGQRLAQLADVPSAMLGSAFDLRTLFDRRALNADIPMDVASFVARRTIQTVSGRYILFYGRAVCMAFGLTPRRPMDWQAAVHDGERATFVFAVVPDLDPRNDPQWSSWWIEHTPEAAEFLRPLVHPKAKR